ncbi:MAG: formylglycine-generating enzyme family protein [Saprospiraceae bacterium]|nr:formylglycine-generating enzyme family protein [Saprospiraceae bacterium]
MTLPHQPRPPLLDLDLVFVEGGSFYMGAVKEDQEAYDWEKPDHKVVVPSFYIGKYPVTQRLWRAVMGGEEQVSYFEGDKRPKTDVSWEDIKVFLESLNNLPEVQVYFQELEPKGTLFRLPTEAEWEFAARGGTKSRGFRYAGSDKLKEVGWYDENSYDETKPVGLKFPNELGLYDMSGNVWEWCEDDWHFGYEGAPDDGKAWIDVPDRGGLRVLRGGGYFGSPRDCRCSSRGDRSPGDRYSSLGFRLVLSPQ